MKQVNWFLKAFLMGSLIVANAQKQQDSIPVEQLDEVVLSDSRFPLKRENSGKVITKITAKDLERQQGQSVAEIIGRTVGIEINGVRSNAGQNLSYFVRGGRNRQVLIMIDGIQVTDASQIANDYDLRLLNVNQVESIEILKGAASTLYGTGAATAVINIKLKQASKEPINLNISSIFGSNQPADNQDYNVEDFRNNVSINGSLGNFTYLASFGHQFTDGLSAIESGTESDAFNSQNGQLKIGYDFSKALNIEAYASFDDFKTEFDDAFGRVDANNESLSQQYRIGISPKLKYHQGSLTVNAAYQNIDREIRSGFPSKFKAENLVLDAFNRYEFNKHFFVLLGLNIQDNQMESFSIPFGSTNFEQAIAPETARFTITDPYFNLVYLFDFGLNINAGARFNNHNSYGSQLVYNINPSFKQDLDYGYIKGLVSYSTAFITPSLFQLFEPNFGNRNLQPEENTTFEVGAELYLDQGMTFSFVYFNRAEDNFIDFRDTGGSVFQYQNIEERFTASGLEFEAQVNLIDAIKLNTNITYTRVDESLNLRIPEFQINARVNYELNETTYFGLTYQFNDERNDTFFNTTSFTNETVVLKAFSLLDFNVSHQILNRKMTLFANVTNILNEDFQELFGFTTRGRNVNVGFNLSL